MKSASSQFQVFPKQHQRSKYKRIRYEDVYSSSDESTNETISVNTIKSGTYILVLLIYYIILLCYINILILYFSFVFLSVKNTKYINIFV